VSRYKKKPVVIEAIQWTGNNRNEILEFLGHGTGHLIPLDGFQADPFCCATIATLEGYMHAKPMDWIIRGVKGELYPCKPDIFALTYESDTDPGVEPRLP
jgi:hypothetical protein